jgi:hypothetical protein
MIPKSENVKVWYSGKQIIRSTIESHTGSSVLLT